MKNVIEDRHPAFYSFLRFFYTNKFYNKSSEVFLKNYDNS